MGTGDSEDLSVEGTGMPAGVPGPGPGTNGPSKRPGCRQPQNMFSLLAAGVPALTGEIGAPACIPALACEMGAPAGIPALSASSC